MKKEILGFTVRFEDDVLQNTTIVQGVLAIGDNWRRQQLADKILKMRPDFQFPVLAHPQAIVSRYASVGSGTVLLPGSVINASARVGVFCSIYTNAVVEHDDCLEDFVTLAPAATLGGAVHVGKRSFIGLGATVNHNIKIGQDCVIAAGAAIIADAEDSHVLMGVPAKSMHMRKPGDSYL